jgi:hypothetical protein
VGPIVRGIVFGWGRYVLGSLGWRAQFARLVALHASDENGQVVNDLSDRYGVEVIPHLERVRFLAEQTAT